MSDMAKVDGRVTVVTVSYNSAAVMEAMLGSLPPCVLRIVVDNGGTDDIAEVARQAGAQLVRLERNVGFGRGCNAGAERCETEFIFFVNPDAIVEQGAVGALVSFFDKHPEAVAANPRIVDGKGTARFRSHSMLAPAGGRRTVPTEPTVCATLLGSALFCRRQSFEAVGGFDPAIFLYHEDDDLAVRMARGGGKLFYLPQATIRHISGHSSGRSHHVARLKGYHMARARAYVMAKHGMRFAVARTLLRAGAEAILPHNLLSARRRAKHLGQLQGALSAMRDGGAFHDP